MKPLFYLSIIIALSLFISPVVAASEVEVMALSQPVMARATCSVAGGFSFDFGTQAIFRGGDSITLRMPSSITLCYEVDLEIGVLENTGPTHPGNITSNTVLPSLNTSLVSPIKGKGSIISTNGGVLFKIYGAPGTSFITINVMTDVNDDGILDSHPSGSITFNAASKYESLVIKLLDHQIYTPSVGDPGLFASSGGVYNENNANMVENALFIDASNHDIWEDGDVVDCYFLENLFGYTGITNKEQIAHFVAPRRCYGWLTVNIEPPAVASAASWQIDGGALNDSSDQIRAFCGYRILSFTAVKGWQKPEDRLVEIHENLASQETGTYLFTGNPN